MKTDVARIPTNYAHLIARELALQEPELPALLRLTNLSTQDFLNEETLLTTQQLTQIISNALRLSNDDCISLRVGKRITPSAHGAVGLMVNSSPNLLVAMQAFQEFQQTRAPFLRSELEVSEDWIEYTYHIDVDADIDVIRSLSDALSIAFLNIIEFMIDRPLTEGKLYFIFPEPSYSASYSEFIHSEYEFSANCSKVSIPTDLTKTANLLVNHENFLLAKQHCELMLNQLRTDKSTLKYKVEKLMLSTAPGTLTEEEAAARVYISKRTLARRLDKEGTSFRQIRESILSEQAADYLRTSDLSVDAIAALLNYHDSSTFRRAFKRWFEVTPHEFRTQGFSATKKT